MTRAATDVVLLRRRFDGTIATMYGPLRAASPRRLRAWFGHVSMGNRLWSFDARGVPVPSERESLGDCRLVPAAAIDALAALEFVLALAAGKPPLRACVGPTEQGTLYRHV